MEVNRSFVISVFILLMVSCSNTPDLETGEIKTLALIQKAFQQSNKSKQFIDARLLINRTQVDDAKIPILFVELPSGQNGTLTPYPGEGLGQTWLGADGATLTLQRGVLKASRGLGDDLMGSTSSMPQWSEIKNTKQIYNRALSFITGNNKILKHFFKCDIQKTVKKEAINIWDVTFRVAKFEENCQNKSQRFKNNYYVDNHAMRRSFQYQGRTRNMF